MQHTLRTAGVVATLTVLALALGLTGCQPTATPFHATDLSAGASEIGRDLALTDHHGKARTLSDFAGKVVVVFFGYTQCPDVCPTNMTTLKQVMDLLGDDSQRVQVIFVTVDPERDTQALLAQYVPAFHPSFLGLVGNAEQTARVAKSFGVFFQKQKGSQAGHYTVDHSAGSYVFDATGKLRLYVRHGDSAAHIADDLRRLLRGE